MSWGNDILRGLSGKPFYERARRRDPKLDAAIKAAEKGSDAGANKYHAQKTYVDGAWFASKGEAERWKCLRLYERAGVISNLKRQVKIEFESGVTWKLDFTYIENGITFYEDFKGKETADYKIKRETIAWEIRIGVREGIYREVKKKSGRWQIKEYRKED